MLVEEALARGPAPLEDRRGLLLLLRAPDGTGRELRELVVERAEVLREQRGVPVEDRGGGGGHDASSGRARRCAAASATASTMPR
ncbi:hypothetical protein GCM10023204_24650 [Actinomycetospora succinea]